MKFMIGTLILAVIAPLFLQGSNGKPLASLKGIDTSFLGDLFQIKKTNGTDHNSISFGQGSGTEPLIQSTSGKSLSHATASQLLNSNTNAKGSRSFYKWKDDLGVWHFTLTPPNDPSKDFTHITTDTNENIIQSLTKDQIKTTLGWKTSDKEAESSDKSGEHKLEMPTIPFPSSIPADQIPKLIEQAQGIQEQSDQRKLVLDAL